MTTLFDQLIPLCIIIYFTLYAYGYVGKTPENLDEAKKANRKKWLLVLRIAGPIAIIGQILMITAKVLAQ